jgi:dTDP-4-dehydrorhamnose 3,5-epimerase
MSTATELEIAGAWSIPLTAHADERGSVTEFYRRSWLPFAREGRQGNLSLSRAGVLRGLHFHRKQADFWCVLAGTAFIGLHDARNGSPTEGRSLTLRVDAEAGRTAVYIPTGVAHGYYAETDLSLAYLVDEYYTGEDEFGVAWNDPEVGIAWPGTSPILSERDRSNPPLAVVRKDAPPYTVQAGVLG